jgi:hypothetical protein
MSGRENWSLEELREYAAQREQEARDRALDAAITVAAGKLAPHGLVETNAGHLRQLVDLNGEISWDDEGNPVGVADALRATLRKYPKLAAAPEPSLRERIDSMNPDQVAERVRELYGSNNGTAE